MTKLSILLPTYNEESTLNSSLPKIREAADNLNCSYEVILINDGSNDNSLAIANNFSWDKLKVITYDKNQGKGYAIKHGVPHAKGDYIVFMDVDLSTPLEYLNIFLQEIENNESDIIIGNRKKSVAKQEVKQPFYRRFFGRGFTLISKIISGLPYDDFTCGFKIFTNKAATEVFNRLTIYDWSFDAEMLLIAKVRKLEVSEIEVKWNHQGDSKVRIFAAIFKSLKSLTTIRLNATKGIY